MHSDYDDEIWTDPVYDAARGQWVLGFLAGLSVGCLLAVAVVVLA